MLLSMGADIQGSVNFLKNWNSFYCVMTGAGASPAVAVVYMLFPTRAKQGSGLNDTEYDDDLPERPSKSQLKREADAAQKLGAKLVELSNKQLEQFDLEDALRDAIVMARGMKADSGRKRQIQLIGKLMRQSDVALIEDTLNRVLEPHRYAVAEFHKAEKWRERLLADQDALQQFIDEHPEVDRQTLRQTLRNAQREMAKQTHGKAYRTLFRMIKEIIDQQAQ